MATHLPVAGGHDQGFATTCRKDAWWAQPAAVLFGLTAFIIYTTWAALQGDHYMYGPYLSPFYSPVLFTDLSMPGAAPESHALLGLWPDWWPSFLPASPALLILVFPAGFRFTCYYYRKAYYRAFAGSPPNCAVGPLRSGKRYNGETRLFLFQNLHRFFLYAALLYIFILGWDAFYAFYNGGNWGVGVGSIVLTLNVVLLGGYTFGCHSFRHLVGGKSDCMSCGKTTVRYKSWLGVTWFNMRHQRFAWFSLVWVGFADFYIRAVSHGWITDYNTWG